MLIWHLVEWQEVARMRILIILIVLECILNLLDTSIIVWIQDFGRTLGIELV